MIGFIIGALGGLLASASKILAWDVQQLAALVDQGNTVDLTELRVTIFIFTPILMFLGGLVGWASGETHRIKLLAIGCAAPALIAPWTTAKFHTAKVGALMSQVSFAIIAPAYAQSDQPINQRGTFATGLGALFGLVDPKDEKYWVIVGARKDPTDAKALADSLNQVAPNIDAFVGSPRTNESGYPVIVGGPESYLPYAAAKALQERASSIPILPNDAALSNYEGYGLASRTESPLQPQ